MLTKQKVIDAINEPAFGPSRTGISATAWQADRLALS
jgi:hypothetical protein